MKQLYYTFVGIKYDTTIHLTASSEDQAWERLSEIVVNSNDYYCDGCVDIE